MGLLCTTILDQDYLEDPPSLSGFTVDLKYKLILMSRKRDFLIMEYVRSKGASKEKLLSMSRVRGFLCTIFVSDLVTADGKYLEDFTTARTLSKEHVSK